MDAFTAITAGIAAQQNSNEPGGKRWTRLTREITDMYLSYYQQTPSNESAGQ
jgi:hypothetical protein